MLASLKTCLTAVGESAHNSRRSSLRSEGAGQSENLAKRGCIAHRPRFSPARQKMSDRNHFLTRIAVQVAAERDHDEDEV
jgi:hypothetical protein